MSLLETMFLSEIKNVQKICLITERNFVINFFRRAAKGVCSISVETQLPDIRLSSNILIILDSYILESFSMVCLQKLEHRSYPVLCLAGSELSEKIRTYVDRVFRYVIPFPMFKDSFAKCFFSTINRMQKEFPDGSFIDCRNGDYSENNYTDEDNGIEKSLFGHFAGKSDAIYSVRKKIRKLADADVPVLLLGETGTGKSSGAAIIHKLSRRKNREMKSLNISAIDESVACSTFFGTTVGAFTDALDRKGFFTLADKGTLFLDEIGLATNAIQSMLLTVVETGKFRKVGSETFEKSDVRLLFATNANLKEMIKEGSFRKDFFCRICGNSIVFPTLRSRREDIPLIVEEHLREKNKILSDNAFNKLIDYDWPGNIRELNQCLDRALLYASGDTIYADDIDFGLFSL